MGACYSDRPIAKGEADRGQQSDAKLAGVFF